MLKKHNLKIIPPLFILFLGTLLIVNIEIFTQGPPPRLAIHGVILFLVDSAIVYGVRKLKR